MMVKMIMIVIIMMMIMASAHKKDFWATKVEDSLLGDEQWHSVTVCQVNIRKGQKEQKEQWHNESISTQCILSIKCSFDNFQLLMVLR